MDNFYTFFLCHNVYAQSTNVTEFQEAYKEAMKEEGYRLLDYGGVDIAAEGMLNTELRTYYSGKYYHFVGIVDECSYCSVAIKFGEPGQTPAYLPEEDAVIERLDEYGITIIGFETHFSSVGEGYFLLFNNSSSSKYMYGMLFERDY